MRRLQGTFTAWRAVAGVIGTAALAFVAAVAVASEVVPMKAGEAAGGTLLLKSGANGETFAVPLLATDVEIRVSGLVARATVRQRFRNPHGDWFEGIYVFPLPENAAVDHLRMRIGERHRRGRDPRARGAPRPSTQRAKQSGQRAALLEQERPNIFTTSVANIGPGESVVVELEYQQAAALRPGALQPALPDGGRATLHTRRVAAGRRRDAHHPAGAAARTEGAPPQSGPLRVSLDAGVPLARVESAYHRGRVVETSPSRREVVLDGEHYANRDFELAWTVAPGRGAAGCAASASARASATTGS